MAVSQEVVQTASKATGLLSFGAGVSSSWWMAFPWADIAIIMSAVGGVFFMVERFVSMMIRLIEYRKLKAENEAKENG